VAAILFLFSFDSIYSQSINHWETIVIAEDTWHYFPGYSEPPADWANVDFDASVWSSGKGGFGYGDNDDGTIISPVPSVYIRINFNIIDISNIYWAMLNVDYDDAFVAYLNGHEIARTNIGTIGVRPTYSTWADSYIEARMYLGIAPEQFVIHNDTLLKYMNEGDNVLALQVHNYNAESSDMSSATFFSVGIKDVSNDYRTVPYWFEAPFINQSNLPLLVIETLGQTIVDEPKITSRLKVIDKGPGQLNSYFDEGTDYDGFIGIEIRGQSSQMFPKKSFSFETRDEAGNDLDVSLLGLPAEEDWILYAPYSDKTMLRNAITFQLGSLMADWQPGYKFCEVYLNANYQGVYLLMEKIKRDTNRVDISKLKPEEISGDDITGGYIVKVDKTGDLTSNEYFYTYPANRHNDARNYAFTYVYPDFDEIVTQQKSYLYNYLVGLENTLNGNSFQDPENGYSKYIDINSFVDFQIMNELANNVDGYRYSTYFYKKKDSKGGKLFAGPLWDFNLGYGNVDYSDLNLATDRWLYPSYGPYEWHPMHWWARLMEDPEYQDALYRRWTELRAGLFKTESIMANLDDMIYHMDGSIDRNFDKWPIIGQYVWPNYDWYNTTYQQEIDYLKTWLLDRLSWMDDNITSTTGLFDAKNYENNLIVFPNPVKDQMNIRLAIENIDRISIDIIDLLGKKVFNTDYSPESTGNMSVKISIPYINNGYYILIIKQKKQIIATHKLIIQH
jgi:hypothetical protein